jgi:large repetitive protein
VRVNLNGAAIKDASANVADLTPPLNATFQVQVTYPADLPTGTVDTTSTAALQVGPATVVSLATSQLGDILEGQTIQIAINTSELVNVDTTNGSPTLTLNDGGTATYDAATTNAQLGTVVFDYTVLANQATDALEITHVNLNSATIEDLNGSNVDFALALNQPTRRCRWAAGDYCFQGRGSDRLVGAH